MPASKKTCSVAKNGVNHKKNSAYLTVYRGCSHGYGSSYKKTVRDCLPNADIVYNRFHVMQNDSKAIGNPPRIEYRKANKAGKELLKWTHYLKLKNAAKLNEPQTERLHKRLSENANLNTLHVLKEQLQALWLSESHVDMQTALEQQCVIARSNEHDLP